MLAETLALHARLLVAALVGWVAWAVWRAPCQQRSNSLLGGFLSLVALGFGLEFLWLQTPWPIPWRIGQAVVGLADPPLLLAYCLTFPQPGRRWNARRFVLAYAAAASLLLLALLLGHDWTGNYTDPLWDWATFLYVTGTYLAAFAVAASRSLSEPRRLLRRQLFFVALAVGFLAFSRLPAALALFGLNPHALQALDWAAMILATTGLAWGVVAVARPKLARRAMPLFASLAGLLAALFLPLTAATILPFSLFFALRWLFFAALVCYGILRYQLFDLQAEAVGLLAYSTAASAGVAVAAGLAEAAGGGRILRPTALLAGLCAFLALLLLSRLLARSRPERPPSARYRTLLLDIYESTLEATVDPRSSTPAQRRLAETLRDLFGVSPEEHARILERIRSPETPVRDA